MYGDDEENLVYAQNIRHGLEQTEVAENLVRQFFV
jgi:hypothetical protein